MIRHLLYRLITLKLCLVFFTLSGCASSPPTRFYSLNSLITTKGVEQITRGENDMAIGIGPLNVAGYLDRPQIVMGVGVNEFRVSDLDRWAGNLRDDIPVVLAENMSALLSTDRVYVYPWKQSTQIHYQVEVTVIRFHGRGDDDVVFRAHWTVLGQEGKEPLLFRLSQYTEPIEGQGYEALVLAQSRILADFSREIAAAIVSISGTK